MTESTLLFAPEEVQAPVREPAKKGESREPEVKAVERHVKTDDAHHLHNARGRATMGRISHYAK